MFAFLRTGIAKVPESQAEFTKISGVVRQIFGRFKISEACNQLGRIFVQF